MQAPRVQRQRARTDARKLDLERQLFERGSADKHLAQPCQ
jgi:hypothetical protein